MRFEVIFQYLYDVGRSVDLSALDVALHGKSAGREKHPERRLDTPESLLLPTPLILNMEERHFTTGEASAFQNIRFRAKVYAEGVVTVEARAEVTASLPELHTLRYREITDLQGQKSTLDELGALHFEELMLKIQGHVNQDQYRFDTSNREDYHVFCLLDPVDDPHKFLEDNSDYLAPFLLGENPKVTLHTSQISTTLKTPFSFTAHDVAIFDMDRAFLIAPHRDYEDLLLIIEHANFQLLELRALDKLLDRLLDDVEKDVRGRGVSKKLGNLQPLRLDSLFILENLENSSRIIGDYYLGQIYDHLCGIFNTQGWKINVERRLDLLQSIYTLTKSERTDSTMVLLEFLVVIMIGIELVALIVPLFR